MSNDNASSARGENTPADDPSEQRAALFARNFRRARQAAGRKFAEIAQAIGVQTLTPQRWATEGVTKVTRAVSMACRFLGIDDPEILFRSDFDPHRDQQLSPPLPTGPSRRQLDQQSNPHIDQVVAQRPDLFRAFDEDDWEELRSRRGLGGALNEDGVIAAAHHINRKRDLRRKFEAVLETHYFEFIATAIELAYQATDPRA